MKTLLITISLLLPLTAHASQVEFLINKYREAHGRDALFARLLEIGDVWYCYRTLRDCNPSPEQRDALEKRVAEFDV